MSRGETRQPRNLNPKPARGQNLPRPPKSGKLPPIKDIRFKKAKSK